MPNLYLLILLSSFGADAEMIPQPGTWVLYGHGKQLESGRVNQGESWKYVWLEEQKINGERCRIIEEIRYSDREQLDEANHSLRFVRLSALEGKTDFQNSITKGFGGKGFGKSEWKPESYALSSQHMFYVP